MVSSERVEIKNIATIAWEKTNSGINELAQFFEDDCLNNKVYLDSYRMVTAAYVDEIGNDLIDPKFFYGVLGQKYSTSELVIPNYKLISFPKNTAGIFLDKDQIVTYITDGQTVPFENILVEGAVDTSKAGQYPVTYRNGEVSKTITVTVKERAKEPTIEAHDSELYVGDTWTEADNFDGALGTDGQTVPFENILVEGAVDTSKAGQYPVTYRNGEVSKTITVTVKERELFKLKDSSMNFQNKKDNYQLPLAGERITPSLSLLGVIGLVLFSILSFYKRKSNI